MTLSFAPQEKVLARSDYEQNLNDGVHHMNKPQGERDLGLVKIYFSRAAVAAVQVSAMSLAEDNIHDYTVWMKKADRIRDMIRELDEHTERLRA